MNNTSVELNQFLENLVDLELNIQQQVIEILNENGSNGLKWLLNAESLGFLFCFTERFIINFCNPSTDECLEKMMRICFLRFFQEVDCKEFLHYEDSRSLGVILFDIGKKAFYSGDVPEFNKGHLTASLYPCSATIGFASLPLWKTFVLHAAKKDGWN